MDIEQINVTQLSNLLRQCETDIIEGKNKLSLTASLLQKVNYALQELEYDRVSFSNSTSPPKEPLKFLQDLIHKIPKLTVTQKIKRETWRVDLSRFTSLKYLELSRIPMHLVEGMQTLRSQLQVLICERCTDCLEEILGTSDVWEELRTAKLCYNDFVFLCPFTNTPLLQYLDLSYNKIEDKLSLQSLKNLKYLNLSFNFLTSVPMLSEEVCHTLKVLLINNNYVQDLAAIGVFDNLEVLDVSHNLLADHPAISPILFLPNLRSINLSYNPISYHPLHRFHTCSYLNKGVIPDEFLLDGKPLSLLEQKEIGRRGETYSKYGISAPKDITCLPSGSLTQSAAKSVSKKKVRDVVIEEGTSNSKPKAPVKVPEADQKHLETKKQVEELRERFGGDHWLHSQAGSFVQDLMGLQRCTGNGALSSTPLGSELLSSSPKLLPSLEKIPPVTNQFDSSASEDYVTALTTQAIIEKIPHLTDTSLSESSDQEQREPLLNKTDTESEELAMTTAESEPEKISEELSNEGEKVVEDEEPEEVHDDGQLWLVQRKSQDGEETELFLTLNEREIREKSTTTGRTVTRWSLESVESCEKVANDPATVRLTFNTIRKPCRERTYIMEHSDAQELLKKVRSFLEARSLSAMNQVAYRCMKCSSMFSLELQPTVLSSLTSFDKELLKKVRSFLEARSLSAMNQVAYRCMKCSSMFSLELQPTVLSSLTSFDKELLKKVRSFLEARSLSAMNQVAYRCMKCSSMFSLELQPTVLSSLTSFDKVSNDGTKCPACGSTLVVEMEEAPLPSTDKEVEVPAGVTSPLRHSPSDCSIGSVASLEQRVEAENEVMEATGGGGGGTKEETPTPRRYDSDIEVISNPSQSSIEVLEVQARLQGTLTPSRKRSNEERPTVAVPQLNTVPEVQPNSTAALTESSSSGSLTDSVCTAYESNPLPARRGGMSDVPEEATPTATYTSLLEGLIQSVTSKLTPKNSPSVDSVLDNNSQYSFTDFSKVDHRVKFYLFQNTFRDDNEELSFILRGQLVTISGEVGPGCLVFSSHSVYVLEVVSPEVGDDASGWFQSKTSHRRSEISNVFALPWQLGAGFSIGTSIYLILFNNPTHTRNFFKFIVNLKEQDESSLENVVVEEDPMLKPERLLEQLITQKVSASDGPVDWNVQYLALSGPAIATKDSEELVKLAVSPLLITTTELLLLQPDFCWLIPSAESLPQAATQQKVANVVDVSLSELELKLHFLNESQNQEEVWSLTFSSLDAVNLVIESIRVPWEQLFSVPLQLSKH